MLTTLLRTMFVMVGVVGLRSSSPEATWKVYIHAHPDDSQLFQSPMSFWDYAAAWHNLLIVTTTAGDAVGAPPVPNPLWWRSREEASKESWRWMIGPQQSESSSWLSVQGHWIAYWRYARLRMVFMRLPNPDVPLVAGCPRSSPSLCQLRVGALPAGLTAVDGSTTYAHWADFYTTLKGIILSFAPNDPATWITAPDFDRSLQTSPPGTLWCDTGCPDHPDHLATADAVQQILPGMAWSSALWINYAICRSDVQFPDARYAENFPAPHDRNYLKKRNFFMAYNDKLKKLTGYDEYNSKARFWENCFQRHSWRLP